MSNLVGLADKARRRVTVATAGVRADTDDVGMNGTRDTVLDFVVDFGEGIAGDHALVLNIADSCALNDVTNVKPLHGLILGHAAAAVVAADAALLPAVGVGAAVVTTLNWHSKSVATLSPLRFPLFRSVSVRLFF